MYSEGTIGLHLGSLGVLHFDEYRDNSEAIRRLLFGEAGPAGSLRQHVALHALGSDDRDVVCAILSLAENGHIEFCQSKNNGTKTDPRRRRCSTTFVGSVQGDMIGFGYEQDKTSTGEEAVKEFIRRVASTNEVLQCSKKRRRCIPSRGKSLSRTC